MREIKNFWSHLGSIFNIWPTHYVDPNKIINKTTKQAFKEDADAIRGDWEKVWSKR